jgi:hypothetical protein
MAERRPLIEGLKNPAPPVDPQVEKAFIHGSKSSAAAEPAAPTPANRQPGAAIPARVPISTRMRTDFATSLKRASLERQLSGVEPNTLQDILEEAVEPWLKANGYLHG